MLTARIQECQECGSLKALLKLAECSIQNLLRNKLNNENYNVETYYCSNTVLSLSHYKRILSRKIYNPTYLCGVDNQDIIAQVKKILFGTCANCVKCEDSTIIPPTSTITSTTI